MASPRDAYHHGDLRNALVAASLRLIEASGPGAFSLREAAREVGVSANAAYRHFEDKSALMSAAAAAGHARLAERMLRSMDQAADQGGSGRPSIRRFQAVGRAYVEFGTEHPELFRLMFGPPGGACLRADPGAADTVTPWTVLGRSLDALVEDGVLPAERRPGAELKAWSMVHGLTSLLLDVLGAAMGPEEQGAVLESMLEFAFVGLCGDLPLRGSTGSGSP